MSAAVEAVGLGKRYGSQWALRDFAAMVPSGSICALVGANGAGKSTLLRLLAGVARPTEGSARVADQAPRDDVEFLRRVGYVAQEMPLYRRWTVSDHLRLGAELNNDWDDEGSRARLVEREIPLDRKVAALSGGMRAQVALTLALGKRPEVLLLDEPLAALDPVARRHFMATRRRRCAASADRGAVEPSAPGSRTGLRSSGRHGRRPTGPRRRDRRTRRRALPTAQPARDTTSIERQHDVVTFQQTSREVASSCVGAARSSIRHGRSRSCRSRRSCSPTSTLVGAARWGRARCRSPKVADELAAVAPAPRRGVRVGRRIDHVRARRVAHRRAHGRRVPVGGHLLYRGAGLPWEPVQRLRGDHRHRSSDDRRAGPVRRVPRSDTGDA